MAAGINLRIIGTSDLHTNIFPYDYYRDRPDPTVGLSMTAALIAAARAEAKNVLLLDNGDIIQGTPLGDYAVQAWEKDRNAIHPMIAAMNELNYFAGTLGNHEFNYGLDLLDNVVKSANFPLINCNVLTPNGEFYFKPWILVERSLQDETGAAQTLKIGVIGFVTPQIVQWDKTHLSGRARTIGTVEAARKNVPALRQLGADVVIALCHSGISRKHATPGDENAALALAQVDGIDAILTGHQHLLLPGTDFAGIDGVDAARGALNNIPAFMPGFWGSHLGVIDLYLTKGETGWRVAKSSVSARPIYARDNDSICLLYTSDAADE